MNLIPRISVTDVTALEYMLGAESWARKTWYNETGEDEEKIIEHCETKKLEFENKIKGISISNENMEAGTCFHDFVECKIAGKEPKPSRFSLVEDEQLSAFIDLLPKPPYVNFEVKETKIYDTVLGKVQVTAKADYISAGIVGELKTTKNYDYENYSGSAQWRFYLDIFQAIYLKYHVAIIENKDCKIRIKSIETFPLYPYTTLFMDIEKYLNLFMETINSLDLYNYLLYDLDSGKYINKLYEPRD